MQDDAAADSRAPGRDLFKEEAVRRTVIINEDLLRIPPLEMVFQSFPQLVPQERSLGDLMEILPAVNSKRRVTFSGTESWLQFHPAISVPASTHSWKRR